MVHASTRPSHAPSFHRRPLLAGLAAALVLASTTSAIKVEAQEDQAAFMNCIVTCLMNDGKPGLQSIQEYLDCSDGCRTAFAPLHAWSDHKPRGPGE